MKVATFLAAVEACATPRARLELSYEQRMIVILVAMSWHRKKIADALRLSLKTVEWHLLNNIRRVCGGTDPALLTRFALAQGWLKLRVNYA